MKVLVESLETHRVLSRRGPEERSLAIGWRVAQLCGYQAYDFTAAINWRDRQANVIWRGPFSARKEGVDRGRFLRLGRGRQVSCFSNARIEAKARQQRHGSGGQKHGGGRLGHGCRAARCAGSLAVIGQHDRQVVDVHRAVAGELALAPRHAGLAVVGQHDGQVVDVDRAVAVGVAGQKVGDFRAGRDSLEVAHIGRPGGGGHVAGGPYERVPIGWPPVPITL